MRRTETRQLPELLGHGSFCESKDLSMVIDDQCEISAGKSKANAAVSEGRPAAAGY